MPRRLSLRLFRWTALGLATVGLGLLYAMVRARDVPPVRIGDISQTMNFAYVRVAGETVGAPRVFRTAGRVDGLRFRLDDGTGVLDIRVRGPLAEVLDREDRIPRAGDRVDLAGSLQVTADGTALWVQDVSSFRIEPKAAPPPPDRTSLADLAAMHEGEFVEIEAEVVHVRPPPPGSRAPWRVTLQDDSGVAVSLVYWDEVAAQLTASPRPGQAYWIRARRDSYRDEVQLRLLHPDHLRPTAGEPAP